jgi:hypothetical protein
MRDSSMRQNFAEAETKARELLDLLASNQSDRFYADALYDAKIVLGKAALHRGDRKASVGYLKAAGETPGSDWFLRHVVEMNLPRALVDWGERRAVAEFLRRMAPKTNRAKQFEEWAAEIEKGVNPDLYPTFSSPNCTRDPC